MSLSRAEVIIRGRVQGVGFRYSTAKTAAQLGLTGWCRNNIDASVTAIFEGDRSVVEEMITWCRKGPGLARVDDIEITWKVANGEFSSFTITG